MNELVQRCMEYNATHDEILENLQNIENDIKERLFKKMSSGEYLVLHEAIGVISDHPNDNAAIIAIRKTDELIIQTAIFNPTLMNFAKLNRCSEKQAIESVVILEKDSSRLFTGFSVNGKRMIDVVHVSRAYELAFFETLPTVTDDPFSGIKPEDYSQVIENEYL